MGDMWECRDWSKRCGGSSQTLGGPSPNPSPAGRGVICEVTPIGLLTYFVEGFSLTELTDLTEPFSTLFRTHRTPPAYRYHRTFQLTSAITFCDICRLLADVCVFSLFAERLLFLCENLWEIEYPTNQDVCRKASVHLWNSVRDETSNEPYSRQKSL